MTKDLELFENLQIILKIPILEIIEYNHILITLETLQRILQNFNITYLI